MSTAILSNLTPSRLARQPHWQPLPTATQLRQFAAKSNGELRGRTHQFLRHRQSDRSVRRAYQTSGNSVINFVGVRKTVGISGKVTDTEGNPVSGATINADGVSFSSAATDAGGNYTLPNLATNTVRVAFK